MTTASVDESIPLFMLTKADGDALVQLIDGSSDGLSVSVGAGIASQSPVPGFTNPPPMSAFSVSEGVDLDLATPPFDYVNFARLDETRSLLYVLDQDGVWMDGGHLSTRSCNTHLL